MIKRELLEIVSDFNLWSKEQETGIERPEYTRKIGECWEISGIAIAIIGARRAGKTFVARQFLKKQIEKGLEKEQTLYVNFEEPRLEAYMSTEFLDDLYETYRHYMNKDKLAVLVLDEIQAVPKWEKWARIMLEKNEKVKLIITGSSSKLLSRELATVLTGRAVSVRVFPLGFEEFLQFQGFELKKEGIGQKKAMLDLLHTYLEYGGFPLIATTKGENAKLSLLKDIFDGIITKDIAWRHKIRRPNELKLLAVLALQNFSSQTSVKRLSDIMQNAAKRKISPSTTNAFLHYLSEAFLLFYIPIFSYKIKDQMLYPKKLYCTDTGIINAVSPRFMENTGRLAENIIAAELVKRHGEENIFYWKNIQKKEVDFAVKEGQKIKQLIQACWNTNDLKTKERETNALLAGMEEFGLKEGLIITEDFEAEEKKDGKRIAYKPIWKWLLGI